MLRQIKQFIFRSHSFLLTSLEKLKARHSEAHNQRIPYRYCYEQSGLEVSNNTDKDGKKFSGSGQNVAGREN